MHEVGTHNMRASPHSEAGAVGHKIGSELNACPIVTIQSSKWADVGIGQDGQRKRVRGARSLERADTRTWCELEMENRCNKTV